MRSLEHNGENHISIGELAVYVESLSKLYPPQFITSMSYQYDSNSNSHYLSINTSDELYPGQMEGKRL